MDPEEKWDKKTNPFYTFSRHVSLAARAKVYCRQHVNISAEVICWLLWQGKWAGGFLSCKSKWFHPTFTLCGFLTTRLMTKWTVALFFTVLKQTNKQNPTTNEKKPSNPKLNSNKQTGWKQKSWGGDGRGRRMTAQDNKRRRIANLLILVLFRFERRQPSMSL